MYIASSTDLGRSWALEKVIEKGKDLREPYLLEVNGTLFFYFFEAGTNPIAFEPSEVAWQYHVIDDVAYTIREDIRNLRLV